MKKQFTIINLLKLANAYSVRSEKLFSISKIWDTFPFMKKADALLIDGKGGLADKIRQSHNLYQFITKMKKNHGTAYTIKWLKCCHVALQKYLGDDKLESLRALEPNLPLPRLINGCPAFINASDRKKMREGNKAVMRFWLTQFSVYRVLSGPGKVGVESIYEPFNGSSEFLRDVILYLGSNKKAVFFDSLGIKDIKIPRFEELRVSYASSPSNKVSYLGFLTDYDYLRNGRTDKDGKVILTDIWKNLTSFRLAWNQISGPSKHSFSIFKELDNAVSICKKHNIPLRQKGSINGSGLSSFAIKVEAAGKIRVFALIDSISQSVLWPLHQYLFKILKKIPNDGTFDQSASVKRSTDKMAKYGQAFSFDLSSATDRLPWTLTAAVFDNLFGVVGFGKKWGALMVDRDFSFPDSISKISPWYLENQGNNYRYSVGQPMGGLSSWAGLAITHHWILQYLWRQLSWNNSQWCEAYEILGDDIVIFDPKLANSYLDFMKGIGVGISASKSCSSKDLFEFAKKTVKGQTDISGISLNQLISASSVAGRVINSVDFINRGIISSLRPLIVSLNRGLSPLLKLRELALPAISLLGLLHSRNAVEHRVVIGSLINPRKDFDFRKSEFDLPLRTMLRYSLSVLTVSDTSYPFSREAQRDLYYQNMKYRICYAIIRDTILSLERFYDHFEKFRSLSERSFVSKIDNMPRAVNDQLRLVLTTSISFEDFPKLGSLLREIYLFKDEIISLSEFKILDEFPTSWFEEAADPFYRTGKHFSEEISFRKELPVREDFLERSLAIFDFVDQLIKRYSFKVDLPRRTFERDSTYLIRLLRKSLSVREALSIGESADGGKPPHFEQKEGKLEG